MGFPAPKKHIFAPKPDPEARKTKRKNGRDNNTIHNRHIAFMHSDTTDFPLFAILETAEETRHDRGSLRITFPRRPGWTYARQSGRQDAPDDPRAI